MDWESCIRGFKAYLQFEKSLADNSVSAYLNDLQKLRSFFDLPEGGKGPDELSSADLSRFVKSIAEYLPSPGSQARMLSGIRSFFKYLLLENIVDDDPTELLEGPRLKRKLPSVLSVEEIEEMIAAIDHSTLKGQRLRVMIELLYGCGLRVSELTGLRRSDLHLDANYIRVIGKGNKERLVPIGASAASQLQRYLDTVRVHQEARHGFEDFIFLNRFGKKISRISVFTAIKDLAKKAGMKKVISPHTFRHSYATHMVNGGANLRAVQQMLGHESITTTEIYTHLSRDYLRDTLLMYHPRYRKKKS